MKRHSEPDTPLRARSRQRALVIAIAGFGLGWVLLRTAFEPLVVPNREAEPSEEETRLVSEAKLAAIDIIERHAQPDRFYKRDAHAPPHGCVQARFTVRPDLPERFRQGVFRVPGRSYEAWVRFSNGIRSDDNEPDARGMSIKLLGVEGKKLLPAEEAEPTQDFVMINHDTFFAADVSEYLDFFQHQSRGDDFGYFIGFNPFRWHLRELWIGIQLLTKKTQNPLGATYHSMLPYKLGPDQNIKFSVQPCDPHPELSARTPEGAPTSRLDGSCPAREPDTEVEPGPHFLRAALVRALAADHGDGAEERGLPAAHFAFRVQPQVEGARMPIEDASLTWSETASPLVAIADLTIPYQRFDSEEQNRFCENLSFNPWHALPEHRPIGGLNRARRVVYEAISTYRHEHNGVAKHEPLGLCLRLDGQACAPDSHAVRLP